MRDDIKNAILDMYDRVAQAQQAQALRGHTDQGGRRGITSGTHLDAIAAIIKQDLVAGGFQPTSVYEHGHLCTLPGWFRPTKNWDLLAFEDSALVAAVELKSISSSFGNNANNRAEESIGSAFDARVAFDNDLFGHASIPPVMGYVMIIRDCAESRMESRAFRSMHFPIDATFFQTSYLDRFRILCERLRRQSLYQAVWLVYANPDTREVTEPSSEMTYEKFIANIVMALQVHRA